MTDTLTQLDPAELAGKTREELLAMCRERGLAATAWKKGRMEQALLAGEAPAPGRVARVKKTDNALAQQLARRSEDGSRDAELKKLRERLELHTGPCQSKNGCKCEGWVPGGHDAFHWPICETCTHTRHAHARVEQCPEPSEPAAAAVTSEP